MSARATKHILAVLVSIAVLVVASTSVWAAEPVTLELQAPKETNLGDEVSVTAVLRDGRGAPVRGEKVRMWTAGDFLGTNGAIDLGEVATDSQGRAEFVYEVRKEKSVTLNVFFLGNSQYEPAQASADIAVQGSAQLTRHPVEGVRVPGVGVWILVGILGGVWGTYFSVMVFLTLIAREGAKVSNTVPGGRRG